MLKAWQIKGVVYLLGTLKAFVPFSFPSVNWLLFNARLEMDIVQDYVKPLKDFAKDSMRLVKRCTKPDLKGKLKNSINLFLNSILYNNMVNLSSWFCF